MSHITDGHWTRREISGFTQGAAVVNGPIPAHSMGAAFAPEEAAN